jgi:ferritin
MGLVELAQFFHRQSEEEREHAMKFVHFMLETEARPIIPAIPARRRLACHRLIQRLSVRSTSYMRMSV